jgi:ribosomal protein L37AE/L43A
MDTVEVYVEYDWVCPACETRQMETMRKSELICESCGTRFEPNYSD